MVAPNFLSALPTSWGFLPTIIDGMPVASEISCIMRLFSRCALPPVWINIKCLTAKPSLRAEYNAYTESFPPESETTT